MQHKLQFLAVFVLLALISIGVFAQDTVPATVQVTTTDVRTHPSQGDVTVIDDTNATLMSTEEGIAVSMSTAELEVGHVYTMWVVVVNHPEACEANPCTGAEILGNSDALGTEVTWGDGILFSDEARMEFAAFLPAGDVAEGWFGNGITNPLGAEVHLVINDHGEAIPAMVPTMLNTLRGGCTDESVPPPYPNVAKADGEPGPNTCRLMQFAIFVQ